MNSLKEKLSDASAAVQTQPIQEGSFTKKVENQTAKVPSIAFLTLAVGSMALSAGLKAANPKSETASFIGLWAPTFLLLGIYNKLVKLEGNDRYNRA